LDDFGRGLTSLKLIELFQFECIKIDKNYFWEIQGVNDFTEILRKIKSYSDFVIVEGVETIEQKNKVFSIVDSACQGRLWKGDYYYIEC
jgi:EAL domain-containing protein (putative c-di-GMP-specific phosphodiesterase class I)